MYFSIYLFISVQQSITKLKIAFTEKLINERFYFSTHNQMSGRDQGSSSLGHLLSSMPYRDTIAKSEQSKYIINIQR